MWSELRAERVAGELAATTEAPLPTLELLAAVDALVDQVVPADASCWSTFDPATTMVTCAVGRHLDEHGEAAVRFFELEYARDTPGQYRQLLAAPDALVIQDIATVVTDDGAEAVRDHLGAMGVHQELRVLLRHQRAGWGGGGLMRAEGSPGFTDDELRFVRHVAPLITTAVRASLVRSEPTLDAIEEPGLGPAVVVFEGDVVADATPAATHWLDRLGALDRGHGSAPPSALMAVAAGTLAGRSVAQRARTADGTWLVLRGAPLGNRRAIVTIEEAGPPDVTAIVSAALGMTARETDVVMEVLKGASTKEIAVRLHLSTYTVQDHLKTVFAKAGVNSRRELIADVFFGVYAPRLGRPVGADGFFR